MSGGICTHVSNPSGPSIHCPLFKARLRIGPMSALEYLSTCERAWEASMAMGGVERRFWAEGESDRARQLGAQRMRRRSRFGLDAPDEELHVNVDMSIAKRRQMSERYIATLLRCNSSLIVLVLLLWRAS
eukprot:3414619-Pleurochrysis_carterae.AAC.3